MRRYTNEKTYYRGCRQWCNRQGGGRGADTFHQEFFADLLRNEREEKRENGEGKKKENGEEKKRRKIVKWKVENWSLEGGRYENEQRTFWNQQNLFGFYQNGNFYREKALHARKKIGKSDFGPPPPSLKYLEIYKQSSESGVPLALKHIFLNFLWHSIKFSWELERLQVLVISIWNLYTPRGGHSNVKGGIRLVQKYT